MAEIKMHSINIFDADGARTTWEFQFDGVMAGSASGTTPYLYPADVRAQELYVNEDLVQIVIERTGSLIQPNQFKIDGAPVINGRQVKIYRSTEVRFPLVDYRDRQTVSELDLDMANRQFLFLAQEVADQSRMAKESADLAGTAIAAAELAKLAAQAAALSAMAAELSASQANAGVVAIQASVDALMDLISASGVQAFNGRTGIVVPVTGDYSATMITRGASNVSAALTALETTVATHTSALAAVPTTIATSLGNYGIGAVKVSDVTDIYGYKAFPGAALTTPASGLTNLPPRWPQGRYLVQVSGGNAYCELTITDPLSGVKACTVWNGTVWGPWRDVQFEGERKVVAAATVSGVITLTPDDAAVFSTTPLAASVTLAFAATTRRLTGRELVISAIFAQDSTGGRAVFLPGTVRLPEGVDQLVSTAARAITYVDFTTVDAGATWLVTKRVVFRNDVTTLPSISSENASFNDEGTATTGWTASNSTMAVASSFLRNTKVAGGSNSSITKAVTFTPTDSDYILYGSVRASTAATGVIWLLNGSKEVSIWFGSATANTFSAYGDISICGTTGTSTRNVVSVASGKTYATAAVEFALQFDKKFGTLTCWFRESGRWKYRGRVLCDWFSAPNVQVLLGTPSAAGEWVEFDYLTLARPNIAMLSDSIGEGKTLFSPNPSLGLTNDESTWMRHAPLYPSLRNNLIVNKGVGGNTSAMMLARVADVTGTGAKVVFLHASSNDAISGVTQAVRKSNIQSTVDAIAAAGAATVLLNGSNGTQTGSDNTPSPTLRDYMQLSWSTQLVSLTGVAARIDIMQALKDSNNFLASGMAADGIHPNITGHMAVGAYIATF